MHNDLLDDDLFKNHLDNIEEIKAIDSISTVDWKPLKNQGSNFKTHTLVSDETGVYRFKSSKRSLFFVFCFLIPGICTLIGGLISMHFFFMLHGGLFATAGYYLLFNFTNSCIFDFNKKVYYQQKSSFMDYHFNGKKEGISVNFQQIKGIQVIKEWVKGKNSRYNSYEINLILSPKKRINVIDHGHYKSTMKDARTLAALLKVPFYNGTTT